MTRPRVVFTTFLLSAILFFAHAAMAETPYRADSGLTKAEAQLNEGKYMQALESANAVLARRPADADALTYAGLAWYRLGQMDKATIHFGRALKADPLHLGANKYAGDLFLETGDIARAAEQLQVIRMACGGTDCAELDDLQSAINRKKSGKAEEQGPAEKTGGKP